MACYWFLRCCKIKLMMFSLKKIFLKMIIISMIIMMAAREKCYEYDALM